MFIYFTEGTRRAYLTSSVELPVENGGIRVEYHGELEHPLGCYYLTANGDLVFDEVIYRAEEFQKEKEETLASISAHILHLEDKLLVFDDEETYDEIKKWRKLRYLTTEAEASPLPKIEDVA